MAKLLIIVFVRFCGTLRLAVVMMLFVLVIAVREPSARGERPTPIETELPSVQEMIDARTDVWGDAARREPNGASFEFFEGLLPPLRWVNTDFRHYPLVLSAPRSARKARLVSNGSAVNPRANKPPMWYEQGVPVAFHVGESAELFGDDLARLAGPRYLDGYLPVVTLRYEHDGIEYQQEAFAPVDGLASSSGALMVRFSLVTGAANAKGKITARITSESPLRAGEGRLLNQRNQVVVAFARSWRWDGDRQALVAELSERNNAVLAILTQPADKHPSTSNARFEEQQQECVRAWNEFLDRGIRLHTPEKIVDDAWRAMLIGTSMIAVGDRLHHSAGNAYAKLYEGECGDTLRSVMLFGQLDAAPQMLKPLLEFDRHATRFHVAGHKLQLLAYFYWLTRDAATIQKYEPLWRPSVELILASREADSGLLPKDNYAGDIKTQVYSLNSNANCWRGLRDVAAVLDDIGDKAEATRLRDEADVYRRAILAAVDRSVRLDATPPFIPVALLSDEPAHDPLTATRTGSYYNLICPYVIGSEIFGQGSQREDWLLGYLENHGAISMGMIRTTPHQGQFNGEPGVNPLYGLRYQLALLRRDEGEKALVGFYGQLAQGMTRDTFIGGEGSRFLHGDADGRSFYLPPNSTSNAAWLVTLRNLLVQDWDIDEDARPDTLRLLFAAPRRWLDDGKRIQIENAPTMFGPVSCRVESKLSAGQVDIRVAPPPRPIKRFLLRVPLPDGWRIEAAEIGGAEVSVEDSGTIDLTGRAEEMTLKLTVTRS